MGKGDRKTKKGKITMGTFGVRRPKKQTVTVPVAKKKKPAAKKAAPAKAKKAVAEKKPKATAAAEKAAE